MKTIIQLMLPFWLAAVIAAPIHAVRAEDGASSAIRAQTEAAIRAFLTALEDKDMDALAALWAEEAVQDMPFSPPGFPKRVEGRENLIAHYAAWPDLAGDAEFTENLRFYPMLDPEMTYVEFTGVVDILPTGRRYEQTYGGLFHVVDGKILLFREYYDPAAFTYAFDLSPETTGSPGAQPQ